MTDLKVVKNGWKDRVSQFNDNIDDIHGLEVSGRIVKLTGLVMEAVGIELPVGSACVVPLSGGRTIEAEVVGFDGDRTLLMPHGGVDGILPGAKVFELGSTRARKTENEEHIRLLPVGEELLGRVIDAAGRPLDELGPIITKASGPLSVKPLNPLRRAPIKETLDVGVRAINSLLTVGRGQRMGLFAGSGVGKSVLLGMMARYTTADVIVVGLIGERGREVQEFIEQILGEEGLKRAVVVAAPADEPALMRLQGASYTTAIAEHFRDQGKNVLMIMDSLTRYAMAQREIALAVGEPPATKGYPPSVFAKLPALVERTGNGRPGEGSITAFYTVLTEGDDQQDPIADAARAILDGHIVLSRQLAESGHYPAIDIEQSISRAMHNITTEEHQLGARKLKQLTSLFTRNQDLINVGAYVRGADASLDEAIDKRNAMRSFLQQDINYRASMEESVNHLKSLWR